MEFTRKVVLFLKKVVRFFTIKPKKIVLQQSEKQLTPFVEKWWESHGEDDRRELKEKVGLTDVNIGFIPQRAWEGLGDEHRGQIVSWARDNLDYFFSDD